MSHTNLLILCDKFNGKLPLTKNKFEQMKTMTCKQLGGPCDKAFHANTFEEMVEKSKNHGMEMFQKGDEEHIKVMNEMKEQMKRQAPDDMKAWFENKRKEFDALPSNE